MVQILGTSSEATAQSYVKEQGAEYRYFKKTLQGKPLYVVTYGSFADRNAALAAYLARLQRETKVRYEPGYAPGS